MLPLRFIISVLLIALLAGHAAADVFRVDPAATYLHTNNDPAPDALVIDLSKLSFPTVDGDTLRIQRQGTYGTGADGKESETAMLGVFSVTRTLLSSGRLARVTGAISGGFPFVTDSTQNGSQATDIVQDFLIDSGGVPSQPEHSYIDIKIPKDARYLFIAAYARHYTGNTDSDGDFAVSVALAPTRVTMPNAVPRGNARSSTPGRPGKPVLSNVTLFRTDGTGSNLRSTNGVVSHGEWTTVLGQQNIPGNYAAQLFLSSTPSPSPEEFVTPARNLSLPLQIGDNVFYFFGTGDDLLGGNVAFGVNLYFNAAASSSPSISAFIRPGPDQPPQPNFSELTGGYDCHIVPGAGSLTWTSGNCEITLSSIDVTPADSSSVDLVYSTNTRAYSPPAHADGVKDTYGKFTLTVVERSGPPAIPGAGPVQGAGSAPPAAATETNATLLKALLIASIVGIILLFILVVILGYFMIQRIRRPPLRFPPPTRYIQ